MKSADAPGGNDHDDGLVTGSRSFRSFLQTIPDRVAEAEADGHPLVVEFPPDLKPAQQRLIATMGCLVRFSHPKVAPTAHRGETPSRATVRELVARAAADADDVPQEVRDWLEAA